MMKSQARAKQRGKQEKSVDVFDEEQKLSKKPSTNTALSLDSSEARFTSEPHGLL